MVGNVDLDLVARVSVGFVGQRRSSSSAPKNASREESGCLRFESGIAIAKIIAKEQRSRCCVVRLMDGVWQGGMLRPKWEG